MLKRLNASQRGGVSRPWKSTPSPLIPLILLVGLGSGFATAYLLVRGDWQIAIALLCLLPGLILLHKHPFLTIIVWLLVGPFLLHTNTTPERTVYWLLHRGLPPLTVGLILLSSALGVREVRLPKLSVAEIAMLGYLLFGTVSIILLNSTPMATLYLFYDRVFSPMCLYLIIRLTYPGEKEWRWLLPVLFILIVSQSVVGVLSWVAPSVLPGEWLDKVGQRTTGTLVNPSIYTTALVFAGLLLLHGATRARPGKTRHLLMVTFLLCAFSIFISFSRASWLAAILVIVGLVALYPRLMTKLAVAVALFLLLFGNLLFGSYIDKASQRLYSDQAEGSALDRLPGFLAAYRMFEAKPAFGWGYDNFDVYDRQFMGRVLDFANDNKDHASHNWFLSMLAEQGLVGSALFFAPLVWWAVQSIRRWPRIPKRGIWNRKLLILLWLIVLSEIVINNFMNMIIFFGHGIWWIVLGLIANLVDEYQTVGSRERMQRQITAVWQRHLPQQF